MEPQYTTFYLARHGETEANVKKIVQGHGNALLTELGQEQAKELGERLKDVHFDAAFSSDLFRAKRTAEIALLDRQMAVTTTELLRERFFGIFEDTPEEDYLKELNESIQKFEQLAEHHKATFRHHESMETHEETAERLIRFLREAALAYAGKCILVVAHGFLLRSFLIKLGFATYKELGAGTVSNGAYAKIESDGIDFFVKETFGVNKKLA